MSTCELGTRQTVAETDPEPTKVVRSLDDWAGPCFLLPTEGLVLVTPALEIALRTLLLGNWFGPLLSSQMRARGSDRFRLSQPRGKAHWWKSWVCRLWRKHKGWCKNGMWRTKRTFFAWIGANEYIYIIIYIYINANPGRIDVTRSLVHGRRPCQSGCEGWFFWELQRN